MADPIRTSFMQPEEPTPSAEGRGGLAEQVRGGLAKFVGDVNKGLEVVLSNPLYARLWSGAVSGQANDPMAGPMALNQMRLAKEESHLNLLREVQRNRTMAMAEKEQADLAHLQQTLASGDQRSIREAFARVNPQKAAEMALAPPESRSTSLKVIDTPQGPRYVTAEEAEGKAPYYKPPNSAMQIVGYDDQGRPLIQFGGSPVTNATRSKIEGQQLDAQDTLARLSQIRSAFRPEFQQWGTKLGQRWSQMKDAAGVGLSDAERSELVALSQFQGSAYENMSLILNQLSGAAISPAEFERLKRFLPNVGSGVFDGDSPTAFAAKLDGFEKSVRAAIKRYESAKVRGTGTPFDEPLSGFEDSLPTAEQGGMPKGSKPHPTIPGLFIDPEGSVWVP